MLEEHKETKCNFNAVYNHQNLVTQTLYMYMIDLNSYANTIRPRGF